MENSLRALLRSRKFLVLALDAFASVVLYFAAKFAGASAAADVKFLVGALQAPALMLIYAIAHEDAAAKRAERG